MDTDTHAERPLQEGTQGEGVHQAEEGGKEQDTPPPPALRSNAFISDFQPPQLCDNEFLGFFLCLHAILFTSISFSVNNREEIGHSIFLIRMEGKMAMKKKMGLFPR